MRDDNEAATSSLVSPPSSQTVVGVIETDLFCDHCGFNLHTQKVWRDERLGILVCRCPECGAHQAAGERSTAAMKWLQRLAIIGALVWVGLGVLFVIGMFFFAIGIHAAAEEGLTYRRFETLDGLPVESSWNTTTQKQEFQLLELADGKPVIVPNESVVFRRRLAPWVTPWGAKSPDDGSFRNAALEAMTAAFFLAVGWYTCSVILASGSWFWRRGRRWAFLLIPILAGSTVWLLMAQSASTRRNYWGNVNQVDDVPAFMLLFVVAIFNVLLMAFGLVSGRAVARFILMLFCPPKLRQSFAFLWHCDGKTLTSVPVKLGS